MPEIRTLHAYQWKQEFRRNKKTFVVQLEMKFYSILFRFFSATYKYPSMHIEQSNSQVYWMQCTQLQN